MGNSKRNRSLICFSPLVLSAAVALSTLATVGCGSSGIESDDSGGGHSGGGHSDGGHSDGGQGDAGQGETSGGDGNGGDGGAGEGTGPAAIPEVCLAPDGGQPDDCPGASYVEIASGEIVVDTVFCSDKTYHVTADLQVRDDATLTICPGATVEFASDTSLIVGRDDQASIIAIGTTESPVRFTSDQAVPAAGDWEGVFVAEGAVSAEFRNVIFEYGADYSYDIDKQLETALAVIGSQATVVDCTFQNNALSAVRLDNGAYASEFHGNTFADNGLPTVQVEPNSVGTLSAPNTFRPPPSASTPVRRSSVRPPPSGGHL